MEAPSATRAVTVRREDGVAHVTVDRPPLNVYTMALMGELGATIRELSGDTELRLITIRGAGRAFSAGVDVGEHLGDNLGPMLDAFAGLAHALLACDVPTLAVVRGAALGGAAELVALCDLAIAAQDAKIGTPEIALAAVPPVAAAFFHRLVGLQRANALVLTGDPISGADAAAWGLVWKSVPAERLDDEAAAVAATFRSRSAASLRVAKRSIRAASLAGAEAAIDAANDESKRALPGSADAQEGLRAFLEKRPPHWTHR